jgi:hypothetical protein
LVIEAEDAKEMNDGNNQTEKGGHAHFLHAVVALSLPDLAPGLPDGIFFSPKIPICVHF